MCEKCTRNLEQNEKKGHTKLFRFEQALRRAGSVECTHFIPTQESTEAVFKNDPRYTE